ncbi:MAG: cupin domain-containing protein [Bacteroidales bacterium]|nr:cupin domain-containing protein [Bacteroidales bacterium]
MKVINIEELNLMPNPHNVEARKVYENEYLEVVHLTLKPGEQLAKHHLPVNVFFFVLEGSGIIEMENKEQRVSKNMLIEGPANIDRGWKNDTDKLLKILVVKAPKPNIAEKKEAIKSILNK